MNKIKIISLLHPDFENYFVPRIEGYLENINTKKVTEVVLTAGPYRPYGACISWISKLHGIVNIDFYSAIRAGFGSLDFGELTNELIKCINIAEPNKLSVSLTLDYVRNNHPELLTLRSLISLEIGSIANLSDFEVIHDYFSDFKDTMTSLETVKFLEKHFDDSIDNLTCEVKEHDEGNTVWYSLKCTIDNKLIEVVEPDYKINKYFYLLSNKK